MLYVNLTLFGLIFLSVYAHVLLLHVVILYDLYCIISNTEGNMYIVEIYYSGVFLFLFLINRRILSGCIAEEAPYDWNFH